MFTQTAPAALKTHHDVSKDNRRIARNAQRLIALQGFRAHAMQMASTSAVKIEVNALLDEYIGRAWLQ